MRITVVFEDAVNTKARKVQAKLTSEVSYSVSFSRVVNIIMNEGLENINVEKIIKELQKKKNK